MPEELKPWILIFLFVVLPFIQWVLRKVGERHAAAEQARRRAAGAGAPTPRPAPAARSEREEEPLPDWLDPNEWESVEELEELEEVGADRSPPPRRQPFDEPASRPRELSLPAGAPLPPAAPAAPATALPRTAPVLAEPSSLAARRAPPPPAPAPLGRPAILPDLPAPPRGTGSALAAPRAIPGSAEDLRRAVIWSEVLGKPRALRPIGSDDPASP